ncbi:hypothetical protein C8T65DRAFT_664352 [Cerioporus squamosus]|nr:hypothetical protein C8T65DRAFT_664352 [Cerioporus squamosus]
MPFALNRVCCWIVLVAIPIPKEGQQVRSRSSNPGEAESQVEEMAGWAPCEVLIGVAKKVSSVGLCQPREVAQRPSSPLGTAKTPPAGPRWTPRKPEGTCSTDCPGSDACLQGGPASTVFQ